MSARIDFAGRLNEEQLAAVTAPDGPLLVLAAAGTGKTRTLTHRIAHLVAAHGVAPEQCLAISFSRHVGIAIGICVVLIAWPALAATALRGYDWGALKARYWPGTTIETTKETIEWVRARTPLGRKP